MSNQPDDGVPKLLPCPFCGEHGELKSTKHNSPRWWVQCANSKCSITPSGFEVQGRAQAVSEWNTRTSLADQRERELLTIIGNADQEAELNYLNYQRLRKEADQRVEDARRAALIQAAKDVCMYCSGHAPGFESAKGPNSSGNYTHESMSKARFVAQGDSGIRLCPATSIHARLKWEASGLNALELESVEIPK